MIYNKKNVLFILLILGLVFFSSCKTKKNLPPRIIKNNIVVEEGDINTSKLNTYIRQKPNKKIFLVVPFHLGIYKFAESWKDNSQKKADRIDRKIEKKRAQNKKFDLEKYQKRKQRTPRKWVMNTLGEAPVLLDSTLMNNSARQMEMYLSANGHFNSKVRTEVEPKKRNRAEVTYIVQATDPYKVTNIVWKINDKNIKEYEPILKINSLIKTNTQYNEDLLDSERDRITLFLRERGFYHFNKSFIVFTADSTLGDKSIELTLIVRSFLQKNENSETKFTEISHPRSIIKNVFYHTDFRIGDLKNLEKDTLEYSYYIKNHDESLKAYFIYENELSIRPKTILSKSFLRQNEWVSITNVIKTNNALSSLSNFRYINIRFEEIGKDSLDNIQMNAHVELSSLKQFGYTAEIEGTNSGSNLGISGLITFRNRNTFKGAEILSLKLRGAVEAQKTFIESTTEDGNIFKSLPFNTIEGGFETEILIPSFLMPGKSLLFSNKYSPKSAFNAGFHYQQRPDYIRYLSNMSLTWDWNVGKNSYHSITPVFLNLVRINPDSSFIIRIEQYSRSLQSSYKDHLIGGGRWTYIYTNQKTSKSKISSYFRSNVESSGFLSRASSMLFAEAQAGQTYNIFGIRFSQYVKFDADYRIYYKLNKTNTLALRGFGGLAIPYGNSAVMPFDKRYSVGGSNDMRAWKFRSLGPGTYSDSLSFDKTGDISLIASAEYRFPVISYLQSALFIDAGNIWTIKEYTDFPGGKFNLSSFYKQIAIGSGIGLRLDFGFFVFRVDAAVPIVDPAREIGDKWLGLSDYRKRINLNFGIGYPF